jgi:hypothetical protein
MEGERSDGVMVLGIIAIVFGIWGLLHHLISGLAILRDPQLYSLILQQRGPKAAQLSYFESIYGLISYPLFIVSGLAVLKMKNWGRVLLVIISLIEFVLSLILPYAWVTIMSNEYHRARFFPTPILIIYLMNVWFFSKKRVRKQFVKESG